MSRTGYHITKKGERTYSLSRVQYAVLRAMGYGCTLSNCYETEGAASRAKDGMDSGMIEERADLQDIPWACIRTLLRAGLIAERRREQVATPTDQGLGGTHWQHWYIVYHLTTRGLATLIHHEDKQATRRKKEENTPPLCLTTQ